MPNGRSRGRRRGRRPKRRSDEKGGRTVQTAAPALFAFMGPASSSVGLSAWRWACASPHFGSRCFRSGQRKAIIRTHRLSETGSDYMGLVREAGVEPARPCEHWHLKPASLPIPPLAHLILFCALPCRSAQDVYYHTPFLMSTLFSNFFRPFHRTVLGQLQLFVRPRRKNTLTMKRSRGILIHTNKGVVGARTRFGQHTGEDASPGWT